MPLVIQPYESEVSMIAAAGIATFDIIGKYLDVDFYGGTESTGDAGLQGHHIAHADGLLEGDVVHRSGNHMGFAVFAGTNAAGDIHPTQQVASHEVAHGVGVVGHHHFGHDGLGLTDALSFQLMAHVLGLTDHHPSAVDKGDGGKMAFGNTPMYKYILLVVHVIIINKAHPVFVGQAE